MNNIPVQLLVPKDLFIKKTHELAGLLKHVERGSTDAVDLIIDSMNSGDSVVSRKMRLELAVKLLEIQIKVTDQISKDQLMRQIASVKVKGLSTPLGQEGERKKLPPKLDFTVIEEI